MYKQISQTFVNDPGYVPIFTPDEIIITDPSISGYVQYPDGETVVSVGEDNRVSNWNLRSGQPQHVWELPKGHALSIALTVDGRYLARGLGDGTVEVFRVAEKRT